VANCAVFKRGIITWKELERSYIVASDSIPANILAKPGVVNKGAVSLLKIPTRSTVAITKPLEAKNLWDVCAHASLKGAIANVAIRIISMVLCSLTEKIQIMASCTQSMQMTRKRYTTCVGISTIARNDASFAKQELSSVQEELCFVCQDVR